MSPFHVRPPSGAGGWATTNSDDLIGSLDGGELDSGGVQNDAPGANSGIVSKMKLSFGVSSGGGSDIIESFITAAFVGGNWGISGVPEPGTGLLLGLGFAALASRREGLN